MNCSKCRQRAVFSVPPLCGEHFVRHVESTIKKTTKKYRLVEEGDKIIVAASGGKDSTTCLYNLRQYNIEALVIDEGIGGYREKTISGLQNFCNEHSIRLHIRSIKDEFGFTLDEAVKKLGEGPCTICGALRRWMLNRHARKLGATKIATGHNLDDEAQSVMMNFFRNQLQVSARLGPITGIIRDKRFVPRIKPLYQLSEKETAAYALLKGFGLRHTECPYVSQAYRAAVRDGLNTYEARHPGTKRNIIRAFLKMLPGLKKQFATDAVPNECRGCGEPSMQEYCKACTIIRIMKKNHEGC